MTDPLWNRHDLVERKHQRNARSALTRYCACHLPYMGHRFHEDLRCDCGVHFLQHAQHAIVCPYSRRGKELLRENGAPSASP